MSSRLKTRSLAISSRLGVNRLIGQSGWRQERLLILCWHGISLNDEHEWNASLYMPVSLFQRRLATIKRVGCTVLPLGDAIERLYRGDLPPRAVALTFDDGYFDFLARAYPRLRELGYPATVYLPTMRCEHNFPVVNVLLSYMLWQRRDTTLTAPEVPGLGADTYPLSTPALRAAVVRKINASIEPDDPPPAARDEIARCVARRLQLDYDRYVSDRTLTLMRPPEVAALAEAGVDFELHTHRHRTPQSDDRFEEEVRENQQHLEAITGRRGTHFCYPSGVYRRSYLPVLEAAGIVSATTTRPGIASRASHPLLLPRFVDTCAVTDTEFEAWLLGVVPRLQQGAGREPESAPPAA